MNNHERQQLKQIGIIGAVIAVVLGGVLLAPSLLYLADAHPAALPVQVNSAPARHQQRSPDGPARATPPLLPTIDTPTHAVVQPNPSQVLTIAPTSSGRGDEPPRATADAGPREDLVARLAKDLACLQRSVQHVPALDTQAAERAKEDMTLLPQTGVIQLEDTDGQRFFLGSDMVADLRAPHRRCGETLVFGVPPLDWLPQGSRFGIGVADKGAGLVIVILRGS